METSTKPEPTEKPEKLSARFFLLAALLLGFFVAIMALMFWAAIRLAPTEMHWNDIFLSWIERRGPHFVVASVIALLVLPIGYLLRFVYKKSHAFEKSRTRQLYWLYLTIGALIYVLIAELGSILMYRRFYGSYLTHHHFFYDVLLRSLLCIALILLGIVIFLFKKNWKVLYGLSEILLSVLSNLALIQHADLRHMPALDLSPQGLLAFGAFTYLLSRGISNVVEGVQELIAKTPPPPQATPPAPDAPVLDTPPGEH